MSNYYESLVAAGTKPEHAAFLAQRDELDRFANREHPNYGRQDDDDWCAFVEATSGELE